MDQSKSNHPITNYLLVKAKSATKNHMVFAEFVQEAEILCNKQNWGSTDEYLTRYRKVWFELEVLNAVALDDWESHGRPLNWLSQWESIYKNEAEDIIIELQSIITDALSSSI